MWWLYSNGFNRFFISPLGLTSIVRLHWSLWSAGFFCSGILTDVIKWKMILAQNRSSLFSQFRLRLLALICLILPSKPDLDRILYITDFGGCAAKQRKIRHFRALQEGKFVWLRYYLSATASLALRRFLWTKRGKSRQIVAFWGRIILNVIYRVCLLRGHFP